MACKPRFTGHIGVLYIQCTGEKRDKNVLLHNSMQMGRVKLIFFLHIGGKVIKTLKHFPSPYMWSVTLGLFEGVYYCQCMGDNRNKNINCFIM